MCGRREVDHGSAPLGQGRDRAPHSRQREAPVVGGGQDPGPGIEDLHGVRAGAELEREMVADDRRELAEQPLERVGIAMEHGLDRRKAVAPPALQPRIVPGATGGSR